MSDELKIRAAKALGCSYDEKSDLIRNLHQGMKNLVTMPDYEIIMMKKDMLKFTTSYDWAMLGVEKLTWSQLGDFCKKLTYGTEVKTIGGFLLNNESLTIFPREIFRSTPEKITQAWVEVLEDKKSAENQDISEEKEETSD